VGLDRSVAGLEGLQLLGFDGDGVGPPELKQPRVEVRAHVAGGELGVVQLSSGEAQQNCEQREQKLTALHFSLINTF